MHGTMKNWMDSNEKKIFRLICVLCWISYLISQEASVMRMEKYKMIVRNLQSSKIFVDEHRKRK